ncbi:type II secretion system minor pseudopilin GspI [Sphaerotilus sp.]|uniref:type II secretion system minor pseudopilin GspI n=1 Tax=Sphaerotilus sp. TaxID=2093942 RepID=UPI002ACD72E7|nr:type II secretion system minor pseudopilin GspI [Sphaerotilus sp.]MDZ7856642.1 type II secretion system minor pseudopilin GspI [Sphaerotilus sp.]
MPRRRSESGQRGLTLIEVLVALAIVAITLAAGIKAAGTLTSNTQRLADTLAGQWCADNYLTRLRLERQLPPIGDSEFSCEQVGQTFQGRVAVRPTPNPLFRRIDVRMLDPEGQHLLLYTTVMSRL